MKPEKSKLIFAFLFIVLFLPLIQQTLPFIHSGKLFGFYSDAPDVSFSIGKWWDGSYQKAKSDYFNDHVGFRPDLLRLNGQADYSLFGKTNYGGTVVGKDNYLFYENYVWAYYGKDFAGYEPLRRQMTELKAVQDTLSRLGISLILVYSPCKAWYCGEAIIKGLKPPFQKPNNYKTCVHLGDSLGINQIDMNAWFVSMKDTSKELLYSRQGIHWTNYGSILGADSLARYMERLRHIRMPHPHWTRVLHTTQANDPDKDMGNILNLIWPIASETFCYPDLQFSTDTTVARIRAIHIGDSYNINFIKTGMMQHMYADWQFWFSFKDIFNEKTYNDWTYPQVKDYDWRGALLHADCIVLLNTPKNTAPIANGFIDSAYRYFFPARN